MKRHNGIDALRIVSMFMIVILHTLGQGGILDNTNSLSSQYYVSWFLEIIAYCAVNCFALISGFVLYQSKPSIARLMQLWLQVAFYTVLITGIFALVSPQTFGLKSIIKALFPVVTGEYWYMSAYFGVYILSPLLNAAIQNLDRKAFDMMLLVLFVIFCVISTPLLHDPLVLNGGYSTLWLCILYIVGAYIHKYNIAANFRKSIAIGIFLLMVIITFTSKIIMQSLGIASFENVLVSYTSPTIALSGIFLFIVFAKFKKIPALQIIIRRLASASLGVYLIHVHPLVWNHVMLGFSKSFVNYNCIIMILLILAVSAAIYLICTLIELLRIKLFQVLKIKNLCIRFENALISKFDSAYETVNS